MKIILPQKFVTNAHFCVLYYGDLNALQIVTSYNSSQYYSLEQANISTFSTKTSCKYIVLFGC